MKLFDNKKGQGNLISVFMYALSSLFGLGIIYYYGIEVMLLGYLKPVLTQYIQAHLGTTDQATILAAYSQLTIYMRLSVFILYVVVFAYLVIRVLVKENEDVQQY